MILDFEKEKSCDLSTKQILTILDFAAQAANDDGFMSRYVFRKALLVFAAIVYLPDRKSSISALIGKGYDISVAFDNLNADGTFSKVYADHKETLEYLSSLGEEWYEDACSYEHSARGLLNMLSSFSGDIVQNAVERLQQTANSEDIKSVLEIGQRLGVNMKQDRSIKESGRLKDVSKPSRRKTAAKK